MPEITRPPFIQIVAAPKPGDLHVLYALDSSGEVWRMEDPPRGSWKKLPGQREG